MSRFNQNSEGTKTVNLAGGKRIFKKDYQLA